MFGVIGGQPPLLLGRTYAQDFGAEKLKKNKEIMDMQESHLISAWERCVRNALRAKVAVGEELTKGIRANVSFKNFFSSCSF